MKTITIGGLLCLLALNLCAQKSPTLSETVYRSFYNKTITIYPDDPDKVIKKRYGLFIDTTANSVFAQNLIERMAFDDYHESLIQRACRDFKATRRIAQLQSFKNDPFLSQMPRQWFEAQELNGTTYIFCPKVLKPHYFFSLTDSTVIISKGFGPVTYFIKSVYKSNDALVIDCFDDAKFTIKTLDKSTLMSVWKMETRSPENNITYRLSVPVSSFKYYNMIVNHSAEDKIPDDLVFDDIDFDILISSSAQLRVRNLSHAGNK